MDDLRSRLESHMTQTERSKSKLLVGIGKYLDGLDCTVTPGTESSSTLEQQLAEIDEQAGGNGRRVIH